MTRIKICGLTREEDVVSAVEAGADAIGFVFYAKSPRAVTPQRARALARLLPPFVVPVGLFVDRVGERLALTIGGVLEVVAGVIGWFAPGQLAPEWKGSFLPGWHGMLLAVTCLLQIGIGMWIDRFYDRDLMRYLIWTLWYPIAFWAIAMLTSVFAVPKAMLWRPGKRAVWTSPDRGIRT